jgi:TatD DNase family protein
VLEKAKAAGISAIIAVGENLSDARRNVDLAAGFPILRPAAGLYPAILDETQAEAMLEFIRHQHPKLVAIGEVGLDFWVVKKESDRQLQKEIFGRFIKLAKELNLPLNVHSRSAGRHTVALLLDGDATQVQMHAFDGKAAAALPAIEAGYYFSIPPSVIRSRQKQKLVQKLPLSSLLVETDSPVLGPDPQKRNEPANVFIAINAIAKLKKLSEKDVLEAVSVNSGKLYHRILAGRTNAVAVI